MIAWCAYIGVVSITLAVHHFDHVLDLVDMFVDESVMQETMAVVKPSAVL